MPQTRSTSGRAPETTEAANSDESQATTSSYDTAGTTTTQTTTDTTGTQDTTNTTESQNTWDSGTTTAKETSKAVAAKRDARPRGKNMENEKDAEAASQRSTSSRKKKAVRLAIARERLASLQVELIAAQIARIEAESDDEDEDNEGNSVSTEIETTRRVDTWLNRSQQHLHTAVEPENEKIIVTEKQNEDNIQVAPSSEEKKKHQYEEKRQRYTKLKKENETQSIDLTELASAIALAAKAGTPASRYAMELPTFGGSHHEWLAYKAAFDEAETNFTESENIARLRRSLRGRAREAVESLLIYNAKPTDIMKTLESRFGRPDTIALAELERIRALPRLTDNPKDVCIFASKINNAVATLRALNRVHYLYNPEAIKTTIEKLTPTLRYRWFDFNTESAKSEEPDLVKLGRFFEREAERCGPYAPPEYIPGENFNSGAYRRNQRTFTAVENNATRYRCAACEEEGHSITQCSKYKNATEDDRWEIAKTKRLCFVCLRYRGKDHTCKKRRCSVQDCRYWHHPLLHKRFGTTMNNEDRRNANNREETRKSEREDRRQNETVASTWTCEGAQSFLKIVPVHISGPAGAVNTHALLDDGSTVTLIDAELCEKIGASGRQEPLHIEAIGEHQVKARESRRVTLTLRGAYKKQHKITARTIEDMKLSPQTVERQVIEDCEHLQDIKSDLTYTKIKPRMLIGQDNWHLLLTTETRRGGRHQPVASRTPLGWVLHGAHTRMLGRTQRVNFIAQNEEANMDEQLRDYFALESLIIAPKTPENDPEHRAMEKLKKELTRKENGRYEAPLLWKNDEVTMPDNYENTLKRLHSIEKKIDRNPDMKKKYTEQMEALIEKGYAEPAPTEKTPGKTWYLPHFAVMNPMKPGKMRIVHDAAAKTKGVSLNDKLHKGPDLLQSMPGVLMRFRQHTVAVSADIKEMFMQVKVQPGDRDALRYLWRGDRRDDQPPDEYRMTSLIFGATCSPSTAIYVKDFNARRYKEENKEAYEAIVKNHYVDDMILSVETEEKAIEIASQVRRIHSEAHYDLRQWTSNSPRVLEALDPGCEQRNAVTLNEEMDERVLGLIWKPRTDELTFNLNLARLPAGILDKENPTKRETLKILMSLFDPLGLASPVTVRGKQILQEIWRRGTGWDENLEEDLATQWRNWTQELKKLHNVRIPRRYLHYSNAVTRQLHIFVDASELAYAAALYWRVITHDGHIHLSLVAAKAKVAPLKLTSTPRLELQAAVLGSRMAAAVIEEHDKKPDSKTFWTDSRTVLTWIKTGARTYRPFVAHRIAEIEENTSTNEWRWLPTKENVADDATRDVPRDLDAEHRWFQGPAFLREKEENWPVSAAPVVEKATGEEKTHVISIKSPQEHGAVPEPMRFSKWERLVRATARVLQFIHLCRTKKQQVNYKRTKKNKERDPGWTPGDKKTEKAKTPREDEKTKRSFAPLQAEFISQAEEIIIRKCQRDSFKEEMTSLEKDSPISRNTRLRHLAVEMDQGILRVKTRIGAAAAINEERKRPAILDGDHHIAALYIDYVHRTLHHAGVESTINECRTRYWILRLRTTARKIIHRCRPCRIRKNSPPEPPTGNLPACRLAHHQRPFTYTGLDYFGPLTVTVGRSHQKRYVALFTCLTTRAVHLEIAASLTTDSAVMALRRMIARRGCPAELWSDNGTNLHGAERELREAATKATQEEAARRKINWRFIPPGAPFMGGAWERLVRSVKTAMAAVLTERSPHEEVLATLLAEVEYTVNSRPLTHVSVDVNDPEALTPNHFLLHGPAIEPPGGHYHDQDLIGHTHWRASQRLADIFWQRWLQEYLPNLQHRRDPRGRGPPITIGDVVIIVDNTLPRNTWPRGVITAVYPGPDGVVRTADVRTRGGILRRPAKKLIQLPTKPDVPSPEE